MKRENSSPLVFKILMAVCVLILLMMIFSSLRSAQSQQIFGSIVRIGLWLGVCIGFFMRKKWAWAAVSVLVCFSILGIVHSFLIRRMDFSLFPLISMAIGALVLWLLNRKELLSFFSLETNQTLPVRAHSVTFAILCMTIGLFIFVEITNFQRLAMLTPTHFFTGMMALIHFLIGLGLWRQNRYAERAVLPFFTFAVIATCIILIYDLFEANRYLALGKSIFYIAVELGMLLYWIKGIRTKLDTDEFQAA